MYVAHKVGRVRLRHVCEWTGEMCLRLKSLFPAACQSYESSTLKPPFLLYILCPLPLQSLYMVMFIQLVGIASLRRFSALSVERAEAIWNLARRQTQDWQTTCAGDVHAIWYW